MSQSDALSKPRRFFYRLFSVLLPLFVLGGIEYGLRLAGYGGYPPFLRSSGKLPSGEEVCLVEPAASKPYFFANPGRPGYADQTNFLMPKPADTIRIMLIGESAAKGYPQPRNLAMSSFLEAKLEDLWPDRNVEIINLGTTAVASFPLVYAVRDALAYEPDLFIFYVGNNEFFGAYGTASINRTALIPPTIMRAVRSLAIVQLAASWLYAEPPQQKTLMEEMMGKAVITSDSPARAAAASNLRQNLEAMLTLVGEKNIPAIVCTTASNESGLAPLGESAEAKAEFNRAKNLLAAGEKDLAREAFLNARDLDPLPWRPTRATEQAIRDAAASHQAILCDIAEVFRSESPTGATGWDLLDDHVHLSVLGQGRAARAMAEAMTRLDGPLKVDDAALAALPETSAYAKQLGANFYDEYRVNHTLRTLFAVPFMRRSNPEVFQRYERACLAAEQRMPPPVLAEAKRWQTMIPHAGGLRPLTGMAARALLAAGQTEQALPLYELAQRQVPDYTSWYLEYVYFTLACREKINGTLNMQDMAEAAKGIAQGTFLLHHGESSTGLTERYVGRLHQLRGEWSEAIPLLLAAREKLYAEDRVACDQALVVSYIKTGDLASARALAEDGIKNSGKFAPIYQKISATIPKPE